MIRTLLILLLIPFQPLLAQYSRTYQINAYRAQVIIEGSQLPVKFDPKQEYFVGLDDLLFEHVFTRDDPDTTLVLHMGGQSFLARGFPGDFVYVAGPDGRDMVVSLTGLVERPW